MNDTIRIIPLGGLDEVGKCMTCVCINDDIFVVETGALIPDKTMPGVDYVIPRIDFLIENKERVKAYILLHGHDDEIGALPFIYEEVPAPIYGSSVTLKLLEIFTLHVKKDIHYDLRPVKATDVFKIAGRKFHFFHTAHNIAHSSGLAIETSLGNIVFTGDFVIENSADPAYLCDMNAIANLAEVPTLALLSESPYASRAGYTAPLYKLTPHIDSIFKNAEGRIFVSLSQANLYNLEEIIRLSKAYGKKVICYDASTKSAIDEMASAGQLIIPPTNYASLDDILRIRDPELVIIMLGYGSKLFNRIALLASGQNEDRRVRLKETDHFIMANPSNDNTEIEYVDAADELYRSPAKVTIVPKKAFLKMHASEEDLKMMASILKPKYYIPVKGLFKDLLANASLALEMGINLNHNSVFVLENGLTLQIDEKGAKLLDGAVPHGDIMIDGSGIGDVSKEVLSDRQRLGEGLVILAATLSRSANDVVAGPDLQIKGFPMGRELESVEREFIRVFEATIAEFMRPGGYNISELRQNMHERISRAARRQLGKDPLVIPLLVEVE
ncbi:MAG: ribonuclease J [Candidatus Enteromonas sp.]|nr:ribonuclease J [Candidatus Enteromonas sp.]